jgi:hypothetical protein
METTRKYMHCKGTVPGTNKKCRAELCETDGKFIYVLQESGRELIIKPRRSSGFSFVCDKCDYETLWYGEKIGLIEGKSGGE